MMDDPEEIAAVFRGTELDRLPIEEGLGDTLVVSGIETSRLLPAWRAARAATDETGRWPVLTTVDEQWLDADDDQIEAIEHAAGAVDPWTVYRWWGYDTRIVPEQAHLWRPDFLGPDTAEPPGRDQSLADVERRTWERLLADPAALQQAHRRAERYVGTRPWFTPVAGAQLVLLPTSAQWLAPAWLDYYGATEKAAGPSGLDDLGRQGLAAAMRQWGEQWGAELVASWGTMLQFVTDRRPDLGEPAWQLALQHLAVGGSLPTPPWELAFALTRIDAWFLHHRP
jgi:hypothetical protein